MAIVGKSGSGKSTLLNMITGIDHPTSGQVLVDGVDIYQKNESARALWRGRNLGIVFQFFQLLPMLNLLENVILPMDYCNVYLPAERPQRAMELLRRVGLEDQATKLPASVSSGQQQAAAIARALATDLQLWWPMSQLAISTHAPQMRSSACSINWSHRGRRSSL